jgi:pantoate--beta-alanine ligase
MGALHEGHASLLRRARSGNDVVALSVFVNPAQFVSDGEFDAYPRSPDEDADLAEREGVDILFRPAAEAMFPPRAQTSVGVHGLTRGLCGMALGQGHFRGVTTAAAKLFHLVQPERVYFGQKTAQQALAVQRMVIDLNFPVEIILCPVVRDADGLALSSRNRFLSDAQREHALVLREALTLGRSLLREGQTDVFFLANAMREHVLKDTAVELDYLDIVSPETLEEAEALDDLVLMAGAVTVGGVRLIDNILVGPDGPWEDDPGAEG